MTDTVRHCGMCTHTAPLLVQGKVTTEPTGWTELTITTRPVMQLRLCPSCTSRVLRLVRP